MSSICFSRVLVRIVHVCAPKYGVHSPKTTCNVVKIQINKRKVSSGCLRCVVVNNKKHHHFLFAKVISIDNYEKTYFN